MSPPAGVMGCGAAEATGLGFVCFVVINPRVLSANSDLGFFFICFINIPFCLYANILHRYFVRFTPPDMSMGGSEASIHRHDPIYAAVRNQNCASSGWGGGVRKKMSNRSNIIHSTLNILEI